MPDPSNGNPSYVQTLTDRKLRYCNALEPEERSEALAAINELGRAVAAKDLSQVSWATVERAQTLLDKGQKVLESRAADSTQDSNTQHTAAAPSGADTTQRGSAPETARNSRASTFFGPVKPSS
jgi:hypothetical protein